MTETESSLAITGRRPVFIIGHPRSGTTLMQQVLSVHQPLWSGPETFWLSHILPPQDGWDIRQITAEMLAPIYEGLREKSKIEVSDGLRTRLAEQARSGQLSEAMLLDALMQDQKAEDDSAERWLEKTPQHVFHLPKLWRMFPDASIIAIVRDPRDVISSRVKRKKPGLNRERRVFKNTKTWNSAIEIIEAHQKNPQMLVIRYEDFIASPQQVLAKMAAHIGIEPDVSALERFTESFEYITVNKESDSKALNNTQALVDQRGVWRKRLEPNEIELIEVMCADTMLRHGYVPEHKIEPEMRPQAEARYSVSTLSQQKPRPLFRRVINRLKRFKPN